MKTEKILAAAALLFTAASAAATPVLFSMQSLTGAPGNRTILVQPDRAQNPLVLGTNLIPFADFTLQPVHGQVITNLLPWGYTIQVDGWPRSAHIVVPDSDATLNAATLINTNAFAPLTIFWADTNQFVLTNRLAGIFPVSDFGAVPDGVELHDTSVAAGGTMITNLSANYTAGDVGKPCWLFQDTTNLTYLLTIIASVQSSNVLTLAAPSPVGWTNLGTFVYGTDNTAAFQAAVNAAWTAGGGVVQMQNGLYVLAGNFVNRQATTAYNESSVITLPSHYIRDSSTNKTVTITLQGLIPGAHGVSVDTNYPPLSGTIIYCPSIPTIPNSGTNFNCVFGANSPTNNYALEQYWFKNLTIRKPRGALFHGVVAVWGGGLGIEDCGFDVDYPAGDQFHAPNYLPQNIPTNSVQNAYTDTAIWTPGTDNNSNTKINRVMVYGWGCGLEAGEHAMVTDTEVEFCGTGVSLFTGPTGYPVTHNSSGAFFSNLHVIGNTVQIGQFTNAITSSFMLNNVIFENKANTTTELYDKTGGVLKGFAIYNSSHSFPTNGLNYTSTNVSWVYVGNIDNPPKVYLAGFSPLDYPTTYTLTLGSDLVVSSNILYSIITNSTESVTLPAGTYLVNYSGRAVAASGSDNMQIGLKTSSSVTCAIVETFGAENGTPTMSSHFGSQPIIAKGPSGATAVGFYAGTVTLSAATTFKLTAYHILASTNSFTLKAGTVATFQKLY